MSKFEFKLSEEHVGKAGATLHSDHGWCGEILSKALTINVDLYRIQREMDDLIILIKKKENMSSE